MGHRTGTLPAAGVSSELTARQGRVKQPGLVLCIGGGSSEGEQPLLFAEEIDKAWSYRLSNVSLVMFFGDKQTHLQFTCEL